jgi:hypothetical protein
MKCGGMKRAIQLGWLISIAAFAVPVRAENEFMAHSAETYGSTGACAGDALTNANEDATYLDDGLAGYDQLEYQTNLFFDGRDITDATNFTWGDDDIDPSGSDFADVLFFSGHSGGSCTSPARTWITPGDVADGCTIYASHTTSSSRHVTFGGTTTGSELEAFVTFGCATTLYCAFTAGAYAGMSASSGQYNILNGFHGDVAEVSGYQSDLREYSNDAPNDAIGDAWLDWMYDSDVGGGADNCPSSILWGANSTETDDFFSFSGWFDLHNNGARSTTRFYKLCGCDPINGAALPSC